MREPQFFYSNIALCKSPEPSQASRVKQMSSVTAKNSVSRKQGISQAALSPAVKEPAKESRTDKEQADKGISSIA